MSTEIVYEWTIEDRDWFTDSDGNDDYDADVEFFDSLHQLSPEEFAKFGDDIHVLGLVRREVINGDRYGGFSFAYAKRVDGVLVLPERFDDAGDEIGDKIPARFRIALATAQRRAAAQ